MSRSRRKNAIVTDQQSSRRQASVKTKRMSNKETRRDDDVPSGSAYKKNGWTWDIRDRAYFDPIKGKRK